MLITAKCTLYSQYTSQYLFNGDMGVKISTDGKFLAAGKLNFFSNPTDNTALVSTTARLYADLSQILSGNAKILFLADIPDQSQLMVIKGKFQMAFQDATGNPIEFDSGEADDTSPLPVANLAVARTGRSTDRPGRRSTAAATWTWPTWPRAMPGSIRKASGTRRPNSSCGCLTRTRGSRLPACPRSLTASP